MQNRRTRIMRVSTVPLSLKMFCRELIIEIQDRYDVLAVSAPGSELDELADMGIHTHAVNMSRSISPVGDLRSLCSLVRLMRQWHPDMVHSITPKAGLLAMMAAWMARVPVRVHSFTGLLFPTATGVKRIILKTTDRITCACATHILPEGQGVKADLQKAHITGKDLQVLGYGNVRGIDLSHYALTPEIREEAKQIAQTMGINEDDFVFIFVGRVVRDKGIGELVEAFSRLASEDQHVHLMIVGPQEPNEDPLDAKTLQLIEQTPRIHLTDRWVEDIRPYYAIADALTFPSYREGFPNVVLEAGAMSLPSIVTDINGSREIIQSGVNGDIIPPHDAQSLYEQMRRYSSTPAYLQQLKPNCRQIIADRYDALYVRQCLKDFYDSVLKVQ